MKLNTTPLYVIDNDGKKVLYKDWDKIPTKQLEEFERMFHQERIRRALSKGKSPKQVKHLTTDQVLRNQNRNETRRNNKFKQNHLQPSARDLFDENGEVTPADMDHIGKESADYTSVNEIERWIESYSIVQNLTLGGLEPERINLLIRCDVTRDKNKQDIARELGLDPQSLTMRLQRTKSAAKKILEPLGYRSSAATEKQEGKNE